MKRDRVVDGIAKALSKLRNLHTVVVHKDNTWIGAREAGIRFNSAPIRSERDDHALAYLLAALCTSVRKPLTLAFPDSVQRSPSPSTTTHRPYSRWTRGVGHLKQMSDIARPPLGECFRHAPLDTGLLPSLEQLQIGNVSHTDSYDFGIVPPQPGFVGYCIPGAVAFLATGLTSPSADTHRLKHLVVGNIYRDGELQNVSHYDWVLSPSSMPQLETLKLCGVRLGPNFDSLASFLASRAQTLRIVHLDNIWGFALIKEDQTAQLMSANFAQLERFCLGGTGVQRRFTDMVNEIKGLHGFDFALLESYSIDPPIRFQRRLDLLIGEEGDV